LKVLVAFHGGSLSGIDTYAEQIAAAGSTTPNSVTLAALGADNAKNLADRLSGLGIRVITDAQVFSPRRRGTALTLPGLASRDLREQLETILRRLGERFDVAHLNHPALAPVARRYCDRVIVAAWFYPHSPGARVAQTWHHTGRQLLRSTALAVKGLAHYRNDELGYRQSDSVVAPTARLTEQLRGLGIRAVTSAPPCGTLGDVDCQLEPVGQGLPSDVPKCPESKKIVICCGDLSHPRKNVKAGLAAARLLGESGRSFELDLIGRNSNCLRADLGRLPDNIKVSTLGSLPAQELRAQFRRADVLLLPSLYEEWGYVATEAALRGARVVTFPVYPFIDILVDPFGACAADMTAAALARALEQAIDSRADRPQVQRAASDLFGTQASARRLDAIWSVPDHSDGDA